jgi:DNA replication protein DnaC
MVNQELTARTNKQLVRLFKAVRFKVDDHIEDIDYQHPQGLNQSQLSSLLTNEWVAKKQNLILTGPAGCGKTA